MFDAEADDPYPKYRIYAQKSAVATVYSMHETVYDFDMVPMEYSKVPVSLISLNPEDMIEEIEQMLYAFDHPIISIENFPEHYEDI